MDYEIFPLSSCLIFIRWHSVPALGSDIQKQYLSDMQNYLDTASEPIYFLSDLRHGHIDDLETLHELANLAKHPRWGVGVSFSQNRTSTVMAGTFKRLVAQNQHKDAIFDTPEKALTYLESQKAGITQGIDWNQWLKD